MPPDKIPPQDCDATSVAVAAALMGVSRSTLYELIKEGRGPRITKIGGRSIITREDRLTWLKQQQQGV